MAVPSQQSEAERDRNSPEDGRYVVELEGWTGMHFSSRADVPTKFNYDIDNQPEKDR